MIRPKIPQRLRMDTTLISGSYINWDDLRDAVRERYGDSCGFCGTPGRFMGKMSVDHFAPYSDYAEPATIFNNLVYTCHACFEAKLDKRLPPEAFPGSPEYRKLFELNPDGVLTSKSPAGKLTISILNLNAGHHVQRRAIMARIEEMVRNADPEIRFKSDTHRIIYAQFSDWLDAWKNPIWGSTQDVASLGFHIFAPAEIGKVLNEGLMDYLRNKPERISRLKGTVFEEVVAELLAQRGFKTVIHVGRRKDTSADILAIEQSPITGVHLRYFIEAKLWAHKVGVEVIDRVYGAIVNERQTWGWHIGLIVAPEGFKKMHKFTPEQLKRIGIELKDNEDLETWLNQYCPAPGGLWLPTKNQPNLLPDPHRKIK